MNKSLLALLAVAVIIVAVFMIYRTKNSSLSDTQVITQEKEVTSDITDLDEKEEPLSSDISTENSSANIPSAAE